MKLLSGIQNDIAKGNSRTESKLNSNNRQLFTYFSDRLDEVDDKISDVQSSMRNDIKEEVFSLRADFDKKLDEVVNDWNAKFSMQSRPSTSTLFDGSPKQSKFMPLPAKTDAADEEKPLTSGSKIVNPTQTVSDTTNNRIETAADVAAFLLKQTVISKNDFTYNGSPLKYFEFENYFRSCYSSKISDPELLYPELGKLLTGPAKDAIENCSFMPYSEALPTALEILKERFGNPIVTIEAH